MRRTRVVLVTAISAASVAVAATTVVGREATHADTATRTAIVRAADEGPARNVILMIGDGMGVQEITAARYYQGVQNAMNVDRLPYTGFDTTYSVKKGSGPSYLPDYTPDSAATATQLATGRKTLDERVSQGPSNSASTPGQRYPTILDSAQSRGMRVGLVTTSALTDATPAAMVASISRRQCQGPTTMSPCSTETKATGGLGSIAEQAVDQGADVLLGGGREVFQETITSGPASGKTVLQSAQDAGYRYVTDTTGMNALTGSGRVLGLVDNGELPMEWTGPAATLGKGNTAATCTEGQRPSRVPSLARMAVKAIDLLDDDADGFFLMVEGGSIDDNVHSANACGQIGETVAFDKALGAVLDYQAQHPDTLVVVTADHSHATQIVNDDWSGQSLPTGYSVNLRTKDGSTLTLAYGTSGYGGSGQAPVATPPSQQHTGAVVPVWAVGPGAASVLGTNDHTELYTLMAGTSGPPATPTPPTAAPTVTVGTVTASSVALSWPAVPTATSYDVSRDGAVVASASTTSFVDSGRAPSTRYEYRVTARNAGGSGPASAPVSATTLAGAISAYAVSGDTWRYNDTGVDLGTGWRAAGYNDASWKSGPTQAGFGDGDERTVLTWGSQVNYKPLTTYARRSFDAGASISTVTGLALRLLVDDGAVVYLNGTELQRFNLPTGTITATTRASTALSGSAESQWRTYSLPAGALRAGANQLAVEVHQDSGSSSDLSFDLELRPVP